MQEHQRDYQPRIHARAAGTDFPELPKMMCEILTLSAEDMRKVQNVYSPIATIRNAMAVDHSLRLVLAAYRVLTTMENSLAVANSLNIPHGSIAAVKAWNTMYKRHREWKGRQNGK